MEHNYLIENKLKNIEGLLLFILIVLIYVAIKLH
jgi:hypothetical protein